MRTDPDIRIVVSALLCTFMVTPAFSAGPTTQPTASQPATTEPATTQAKDPLEARAEAVVNRLLPTDVLEEKREPSPREQMAQRFLMALMAKGDPEHDKKQREKKVEDRAKIDQAFKEELDEHAAASDIVRNELNRVHALKREAFGLLDFLDKPTTLPTTRAYEEDLVNRLEAIEHTLNRGEPLARELAYRQKRLGLLVEIDELKKSGGDPAKEERLKAATALLSAIDRSYEAEVAHEQINRQSASTAPTSQPR